jgi:hypothetical protein
MSSIGILLIWSTSILGQRNSWVKIFVKSMHKIWMSLCKIEHFNSESALFSTGYVFFKHTFLPIFYFEIAVLGLLVREACVTVP